ncbi:putative Rrf2 family transcriptional regulator [Arthrobacter globiformis NBRC 12137]|uniref:Putative Rrf2 family transcriptional regulator n=1 Tax=Arthrobacter globiformis (strain ATCC 8010 / DSM 20124 / JCM 1332 / NBRC 12137 / NCIMB 8907 / NRRL B-2979 / 168) TaxID=1077972 RepID=H0QMG6_ARTG1|nr:Rrf2 family transcriptional regulator [Arthrobacter globiformis]GAB14017.1 putative Rrf2 family transcriptional regulator [Arthrobacter globiformis NBRC 12137]
MKLNQGVEWALHCCVNLAWASAGEPISSGRLAELYKLPPAYLNKQLQCLVRAGVLQSVSGPRGGFQLARRADRISVLDVVLAIEGRDLAFRCDGILANCPGGDAEQDYLRSCIIAQSMRQAELAWRTELARQTVAGIAQSLERRFPQARADSLAQLRASSDGRD